MEEKKILKSECLPAPGAKNLSEQDNEVPSKALSNADDGEQSTGPEDKGLEENERPQERLSQIPGILGEQETSIPPNSSQTGENSMAKATYSPLKKTLEEGNGNENFRRDTGQEKEKHDEDGSKHSNMDPQVLDPDNPLMLKFQNALNELLKKQLSKLSQEVSELVIRSQTHS